MAIDTTEAALPAVSAPAVPTRAERRRTVRRQSWWAPVPWIVFASTLALRLLTAASGPTDWDSAQYAAAVGRFDVTHGQPQPPGYWFYVEAGRFFHRAFGMGTVHSLVLVAALASAAGAGLTAVAGRDLGGWWVGVAAAALVATSPFAWFAGSIAATYSFDLLAGPLLIILAWRARPGSWHGVGAMVALGVLAGFRQSIIQAFFLLALVAVAGSTRRWGRLALALLAGLVGVGLWLVPMAVDQPGGLSAWVRATRTEAAGAARATSVLDHVAAGGTNLGTFAAYSILAVGLLVLLAVLGVIGLLLRRVVGTATGRSDRPLPGTGSGTPSSTGITDPGRWERPWYQSRATVLGAAIVPPVLVVSLVAFAKGGYLLAYLPTATIALLLPMGALVHRGGAEDRLSPLWLAVGSVAVALIVGLGTQRFVSGAGVLPERWLRPSGSLWLEQLRYQAPYADTLAAIRAADSVDAALRGLGPAVRPGRDVVVFDVPDGGPNLYRNAGWALPGDRIALIGPGYVLYNLLHGALYYASGATAEVGPSGSVFLVASPALPGLASLIAQGYALPVSTPLPIGGYRVWQVLPGVSILGVRIVAKAGPRPLGHGI
jgi:hypothetical protein